MLRFIAWLVSVLGPRYRLSPVVAAYLERSTHIGKSDQIPSELIPLAARLWGRGWFNRQSLDLTRDWVLPYAFTRQTDPKDPGFVSRALQPVLINAGYRNWTALGHSQSSHKAIVDPRGLVTPQPNAWGWSLDGWLHVDGELYFPSRLPAKDISQNLFENLPLVQTRYEPARLRMLQETFAVPDEDGDDWLVSAYTVENPRGDARRATLYLVLRPFNPEGAAIIDKIETRTEAGVLQFWVNGDLAMLCPAPDAVAMSNAAAGDIAAQLDKPTRIESIIDAAGLASAVAVYEIELRPHTHRVITAALPMYKLREQDWRAAAWTQPDALPQLKRDFVGQWRKLVSQGMTIRVPDDDVQNAFDANKAHLLVLLEDEAITPGPFLYHNFWFRDAAYMLHTLDQLGYHDAVKNVLRTFPQYMRKDGYLQAQEGEWDSNGQALWTIEQHTRLSGDPEVLHDLYWQILNAAHWIDAARQKTKTRAARGLTYGLLPAGMSAEHLGPNDFYYWDDWWGLAGLRTAVYAAKFFNSENDVKKLQDAYDAFWQDVNHSLQGVAERTHAQWMPAAPYRNADSAMVANLVASYPLQLLPADDPRIVATSQELKRTAFVDGAFFHHVGHGGFGTYLALHLAGSELYQREREAWDALRFLIKHASPTWTWGETIHPQTRQGGHGDGHHGWVAADVVSFVRNALLFEEGDHLVLTPAIPDEWVFETASIKVERAATYFGVVDFTLAFGDHNVTLVLKGKWREPPTYIEWHLPLDIKEAGGDKAGVELVNAHVIRIPGTVTRVVATY